jgi:hypothetical protein
MFDKTNQPVESRFVGTTSKDLNQWTSSQMKHELGVDVHL